MWMSWLDEIMKKLYCTVNGAFVLIWCIWASACVLSNFYLI